MKLGDIMKPLKDEILNPSRLCQDTHILDVDVSTFPADWITLYIVDKDGHPCGRINREVLAYLTRRYRPSLLNHCVNHMDEGLIMVDWEGRIFFLNQTYTRLLGVPAGKIIGRNIRDIEPAATLNEVLETKQPIEKERNYIESIERYVSVRMFPLYEKDVFLGAYSLFKDVTELNTLNKEINRITQVAENYGNQLKAQQALEELQIVGEDPQFKNMIVKALTVAKTNVTVLVRGENGSGKELLAELLHNNSSRKDEPFIAVNCAAIPEALIESELFGYEGGAFTDARREGHIGKFELANGGTLFLDEVGDMPTAMQSKLLRVLQAGEIVRVGGSHPIKVDARVIAATNQPLEDLVERKLFRRDLFYRFNVMPIHIPALRQRQHDIFLLANHFLRMFNHQYGRDLAISGAVYHLFEQYAWPGNVRELRNALEHAVILCAKDVITSDDLPSSIINTPAMTVTHKPQPDHPYDPPGKPLKKALKDLEGKFLQDTLRYTGGNKTAAMKELGLSRRTFYRKLQEHGLSD